MITFKDAISLVRDSSRSSKNTVKDFLPPSKRNLKKMDDLIAPRNLTVADLNNPNIKRYYFTRSQIEQACPKIALGYDKTAKISEYGSGVLISQNGYILTCAHVIDGIFGDLEKQKLIRYHNPYELKTGIILDNLDGKKIVLGNNDYGNLNGAKICYIGKYYSACSEQIMDFAPDIAILHVPDLEGKIPVKFAETLPDIQRDLVFQVGQTKIMQFNQMISIGNILSFDGENFFTTNAEARQGNSGGAVFNSSGELIGMQTASKYNVGGFLNESDAISKDRLLKAINESGISLE